MCRTMCRTGRNEQGEQAPAPPDRVSFLAHAGYLLTSLGHPPTQPLSLGNAGNGKASTRSCSLFTLSNPPGENAHVQRQYDGFYRPCTPSAGGGGGAKASRRHPRHPRQPHCCRS